METNNPPVKSVADSSDGDLPPVGILTASDVIQTTETSNTPTTNFNAMTNVSLATVRNPTNLNSNIKSSGQSYDELSLKDFLKRDIIIKTGSFTSTDTSTTFSDMTTTEYLATFSPYSNKLTGYMGIRAKAVFRLVVNGNRFQQGRYILAWIPTGGATDATQTTLWSGMHRYDLTQITQLPHVEIDLARDTECILEVPYVSVSSYYPLATAGSTLKWGSPGKVILVPYSKFATGSGGAATCTFTVFLHWEDIELAAPQFPQSLMRFKGKQVKRANPSETEQNSVGAGPLTLGTRQIAQALNSLKRIPLLSSVAEPASWAMDLASEVAGAFGWSNPVNLEPTTRITPKTHMYSINSDAIDMCQPLSLTSRNAVETLPGIAGTDIDEMAMDHLKSIFAYATQFTWNSSDAYDSQLLQLSMAPGQFGNSYTMSGKTVYTMGPIGLFSDIFRFYRGGFHIRIKIVCTEFHTGRLLVSFQPLETEISSITPINNPNSIYTMREFIDLRNGNEACITVPYTSLTPYRPTTGSSSSFGTLTFRVLDQLTCPLTVAQNVTCLIEVAGAPDLEFAYPAGGTYQPITAQGLQSDIQFNQSNIKFPPNDHCLFDHGIGGSEIKPDNDISARVCIGEKIVSLNQLLKQDDPLIFSGSQSTSATQVIDPFAWNVTYADSVSTTIAPTVYADYYALFSSMFAISRGGARVRTWTYDLTTAPNTSMWAQLFFPGDGAGYAGPASDSFSLHRHAMVIKTLRSHTGGFEIQVPMYNRFLGRSSCATMVNSASAGWSLTYGKIGTSQVLIQYTNPGTTTTNMISRQGSDDTQFSMFVSVPLMYIVAT